jgi:excisionase family DNA binding protein
MSLDLLSVEEVAKLLRVSQWTVRLWAHDGRFQWYKLGSRMLIDRQDLTRYVSEHQRGRLVAAE